MRQKISIFALSALLTVASMGQVNFQSPTEGFIGFDFYEAEARRGGSSFRSSRSSFRSSGTKPRGFSFGRSSKSSKAPKSSGKMSTQGARGQGKTKASQKPKKVSFKSLPKKRQQQQGKATLAKHRKKFLKPPVRPAGGGPAAKPAQVRSAYRERYSGNPVYNRGRDYDSSTYYSRRHDRMGSWYDSPPSYIYQSSPSFGMLDGMMLYWMINNSNNSGNFAYNNQNNPDWQAARSEMDRLAQDNAELAAKLAAMDSQVSQLSGQPIDPNYVPPDVDADLLLSQEALSSLKPDFRMCVGQDTGTYFRIAALMSSQVSKANIIPVTTHGSGETLKKIAAGECDGGFAQADGYWNYIEDHQTDELPFKVVMTPYKEKVHLVCHVNGADELTDLRSDKYSVWFPQGSGAAETWKNFIGEDDGYENAKTIFNQEVTIGSNEEAMLKAKDDQNACFMYVGADTSSKFMRNVEASAVQNWMVLVDVEDGDVDDTTDPSGERLVYTEGEIEEARYPNLLRDAGLFSSPGDVDTFLVTTDVLVSNKWIADNSTIQAGLISELMGTQTDINTVLGR